MSLKSKVAGVTATAGLIAAGVFAMNIGQPDHQRGVLPDTVQRGAEVRLFVAWQRPYTPTLVVTNGNDGIRDHTPEKLPALIGHVTFTYSYVPGVVYTVTVSQDNPAARGTLCQIIVDGRQIDHDTRDGVGQLSCEAHG